MAVMLITGNSITMEGAGSVLMPTQFPPTASSNTHVGPTKAESVPLLVSDKRSVTWVTELEVVYVDHRTLSLQLLDGEGRSDNHRIPGGAAQVGATSVGSAAVPPGWGRRLPDTCQLRPGVLHFLPCPSIFLQLVYWEACRHCVALASVGMGFLARLRPALGPIAYWVALVWLALYVCSTLMIVQLKRLYEHERELSRIDPLTMAENRRALFEAATRARSFSDRHLLPLSIAYLDLDDFKQLNDRMGHSTGDKLLALAADCIRKALRPTDVVARLGGDEFALLLPQTDKETAASIVSRVRFELDRAMQEHHWPVTFSVGVVSFSPPIASVPQMIRAADEAMYAAKKRGKDRVEQREIGL